MQHIFTRVKEELSKIRRGERRMNIFLPSSLILLPFIIVAAVFVYAATAQQQLTKS
ncbi:MAG: hypothetical protein KGZ58_05690 [Ignavibacteriales bacterium]|nr:hypothetical protein [Ignavibacteriales bacterium]